MPSKTRSTLGVKVIVTFFFIWTTLIGLFAAYRYCYFFGYGFEVIEIPNTGILHVFVSLTGFGLAYFLMKQVVILSAVFMSYTKNKNAYSVFLLIFIMSIYEILFPYHLDRDVYRGTDDWIFYTFALVSWLTLAGYNFWRSGRSIVKPNSK